MNETMQADRTAVGTVDSDQFLTFTLQGEEYGIEILRVQEIKGFTKVRPIPNAPAYIKGAINLRGAVVPILDLRTRFGLEAEEDNPFAVIIVVSVSSKIVGLLVDAVSDVMNIPASAMERTGDLGGEIDNTFFHGMGKVGDKLILLLNVDRLLSTAAVDTADVTAA